MAPQSRTDPQDRGTISVLLSALSPVEAGKSATGNSRQNIESSGIVKSVNSADRKTGYLSSLKCVVAKLDVFVDLIDKAASVGIRKYVSRTVIDQKVDDIRPTHTQCLPGE